MVSAIESGLRPLTVDLSLLGYAEDRFTLPDMSAPLHRQRADTTVGTMLRAKELLRLAGELYLELRARTKGTPTTTIERLSRPRSVEEIEELAVEVRFMLSQDEHGPIRNLTAAVERAGVCLVPIVGLPRIAGLSSWVNGVPVIGISPEMPGDRFRFSLAHELGHLLLHLRKDENTETDANRFAGAILIPQADFDDAMPERPFLKDFISLKSSWGMAVSALVYRAHELEHVDDKRYRALQIQMSKWRKQEPAEFAPAHGQLLPRLVETNGGIGTVSTDLGFNRKHVANVTDWRHLRAA
jgi:Zn-dependent peptidase ImmA (M78 family)